MNEAVSLNEKFTMADDFVLRSEQVVKLYARAVKAHAGEMAVLAALDLLSTKQRKKFQKEVKALRPDAQMQLLMQLEDVDPSLSAAVLREIEDP